MTTINLAAPRTCNVQSHNEATFVGRLVRKIRTHLQLRRQHRINRQAFAQMMNLEDELLKDIGVTRADIHWASSLPLSENAAIELKKISLANRSRN